MKRPAGEADCAARKRPRVVSQRPPIEFALGNKPVPTSTPHSLTHSSFIPGQLGVESWTERALSISAWASNVSASCISSGSSSPPPIDYARVMDHMPDTSRLRGLKAQMRSRSCSPTKKSPQYRNTVLKPANILVDVIHSLPSDIEALLPRGLPTVLRSNFALHDNEIEIPALDFSEKIHQVAAVYRDECRELAKKPGSEPEYRTHLYSDVVEKLARNPNWCRILSANCSDKLWLSSLKPPDSTPILSLSWPPLPANMPTPSSVDSDMIHVRADDVPFNFVSPPTSTELSDFSSASDLGGTIATPKPDITVGLSREAFSRPHMSLLEYWQARHLVFSDPHATQGDMRFPFLIIEAKGLATNGNLIGAQNQAAGGGTCAVRLLASLAAQCPGADAPRIVFSCTTEGAIHELWIHFQAMDEDNTLKQHMVCLGAWKTTLEPHAKEFVAALASILSWGADVFFPQIKQMLDKIWDPETRNA